MCLAFLQGELLRTAAIAVSMVVLAVGVRLVWWAAKW